MPTPTDDILYQKAKNKYADMKHSAYKSGLIVKEYKRLFKIKHGSSKQPYKGDKSKGNLTRWYKEKWRSDDGKKTYSVKSSVFRPTIKVNSKTPTTFSELTKKQLNDAKKEKAKSGRVVKFDRS